MLPHTSNLRSLVKKASVIKRKMSTKSKISVKMSNDGCGHIKDSGKIFRSALKLSILERNHLCLWRRRKLSTMRILPVMMKMNICPMLQYCQLFRLSYPSCCNMLTKCVLYSCGCQAEATRGSPTCCPHWSLETASEAGTAASSRRWRSGPAAGICKS